MPPISDKGKYENEAKIRKLIENQAAYAESGPTFDLAGKYLCRSCAYFSGDRGSAADGKCRAVEGAISGSTGSCRLWTIEGAEVPKIKWKLSQMAADYAERPEDKGFGCSRCEYQTKTKTPDGERTLWCGFWGLRVMPLACCSEEDGPDLIQPAEDS